MCQSVQGFDFTGGQSFHFSHRRFPDVAVITVLRYRAACDAYLFFRLQFIFQLTDISVTVTGILKHTDQSIGQQQ